MPSERTPTLAPNKVLHPPLTPSLSFPMLLRRLSRAHMHIPLGTRTPGHFVSPRQGQTLQTAYQNVVVQQNSSQLYSLLSLSSSLLDTNMSSSSMAALGRSGIRWWLRISIGINISLIIFIVHRLQNGPLSGSAEDTIFRYSADRHQPQHEAQVHVPAPEKHVTTPSPALPPPTLQVNPPPVALPRGCGMCDVNPDLCDQLG